MAVSRRSLSDARNKIDPTQKPTNSMHKRYLREATVRIFPRNIFCCERRGREARSDVRMGGVFISN